MKLRASELKQLRAPLNHSITRRRYLVRSRAYVPQFNEICQNPGYQARRHGVGLSNGEPTQRTGAMVSKLLRGMFRSFVSNVSDRGPYNAGVGGSSV
jgi:hypothetical protein